MRSIIAVMAAMLLLQQGFALPKALFGIRGYSNQSLAYINLQTGVANDSVAALGPSANALVVRGDRLYVVNSGSGFVGLNASIMIFSIPEILNNVQPLSVVTVPVPDYKNPYDLLFVNDTKAYVSCLLDSSVFVFDPVAQTLGSRIQIGKGPEGMAVSNGKVYVAEAYDPSTFAYGSTVSIIDAIADTVVSSVQVYTNPQSCTVDAMGRVHVVSTGPYNNTGRVTVIHATNDSIVGTVLLSGNISSVAFTSQNLAYSSSGDLLAYHAITLDTLRTGNNPYPISGGSLMTDAGDTLYIARTGEIALYDGQTRNLLVTFSLHPLAPYFGLAVSPGETMTEVQREGEQPGTFALFQNFPNPFNPSTTIRYRVGEEDRVTLRIMDILGREVTVLSDGAHSPGEYSRRWNATDVAGGVYFSILQAGARVEVRKLMLLK